MFTRKMIFCLLMAVACFSFILLNNVYSADTSNSSDNRFSSEIPWRPIDTSTLSRYTEERLAFQHIQLPRSISSTEDNSFASLMIVKGNDVILFRDGFDDAKKVALDAYIIEIRRELPRDLWVNKINAKPDFVRIADRRSEKLLNVTEDYVDKNFGDLYRNVRNSFVNNHVRIFRELMRNRMDSDFNLQRKPISPPAFQEMKELAKFSTVIKAKAINGTLYFAEDTDGDDITETFYVTLEDGFSWGYKSGPNIIFIFNNKEDDVKQLIGKLCYEAYYGTAEEEKNILKTFPKDTEIMETFNLEKINIQASQSQPEKKTPDSDKK
jgi:hypothetical protein